MTAPSGVFLHMPGCNDSALYRGNLDGSGVALLYDGKQLLPPDERQNPARLVCLTRDPAGGFYFVLGGPSAYMGPHLFHVDENANGAKGLASIPTTPSFLDAIATQHELFAFDFCSLAVAPDGTIFYQTFTQLWKIAP